MLQKTSDLTKKLACTLGPDVDDLQLRIGLKSGPVTAGVLRGELSFSSCSVTLLTKVSEWSQQASEWSQQALCRRFKHPNRQPTCSELPYCIWNKQGYFKFIRSSHPSSLEASNVGYRPRKCWSQDWRLD